MPNIAIFASHNGSGFDAIQNAILQKKLKLNISFVMTNNSNANVLKKAKEHKINSYIINEKQVKDVDQAILSLLQKNECKYIFLSGYMKKLNPLLTENFTIINSHPSLLPKYGGNGMYGHYVHEAVIKNREDESGVTVHRVNSDYDSGEIILQDKLQLNDNETVESLELRIKELEALTIVKALQNIFS